MGFISFDWHVIHTEIPETWCIPWSETADLSSQYLRLTLSVLPILTRIFSIKLHETLLKVRGMDTYRWKNIWEYCVHFFVGEPIPPVRLRAEISWTITAALMTAIIMCSLHWTLHGDGCMPRNTHHKIATVQCTPVLPSKRSLPL